MDFKYWNDPTDEIRELEGSLLPLWKFVIPDTRNKHVTSLAYSPQYPDMFAVGYGSYHFQH